MQRIISVIKFIWPYSGPYRHRFFWGVVLSIVFALSNALLLVAMKTVFDRLEGTTTPPSSATWVLALMDRAKYQLQEQIGSLLPQVGDAFEPQRALLLIFLLVGTAALRGAANYLSSYCMRWSS
ncbi:MAG: hypothetical protein AAF558_04130, partial [Verrucomicrobiota bacterium]